MIALARTPACLALIALLAPAALAQGPFFDPPGEPVGDEPEGLLVLDLNADAVPDIVTRNDISHDISVVLSSPDGGYDPEVRYTYVGEHADHLTPADINDDGHTDLLLQYQGTLVWLLNLGDGTLAPAQTVPSAPGGNDLVAGDLNADGRDDVVVTDDDATSIFVHLATPDGDLAPALTIGSLVRPGHALIADATGDGLNDILVTDLNADELVVLRNLGGATFQQSAYDAGASPRDPVLTDLDLDGDPDMLLRAWGTSSISVLHNDGTGAFELVASHGNYPGSRSLRVADLNGDAFPDAAVLADDTYELHLSFNDGEGNLVAPKVIDVETYPTDLLLADIDADADTDALVLHHNIDVIRLVRNLGAGAFEPGAEIETVDRPLRFAVADVDLDADIDVVAAGAYQDAAVVHANDGTGSLSSPVHPIGAYPRAVLAADLDGDGLDDLAVAHLLEDDANLSIFTSSGDSVARTFQIAAGANPRRLAAADLDADGDLDLAITGDATTYAVVLLNNADATFAGPDLLNVDSQPRDLAVGDADADAIPDLVLAAKAPNQLITLRGNGAGGFAPPITSPIQGEPHAVALAHIDADPYPDAIVARDPNRLDVYKGAPDATFELLSTISVGSAPQRIAAADANADGLIDLGVGLDDGARLYHAAGGGRFELAWSFDRQEGARAVHLVDLDGAEDLDIVVTLDGHGGIHAFQSTGPGAYEPAQTFSVGHAPQDATLGLIDDRRGRDLAAVTASGLWLVPGNTPNCPADFNADGQLNILDFVAFQIAWQVQDPAADCDANGAFDVLDFTCFQALFQKGCP